MFRLKFYATMFAFIIGLLTTFNQTARAESWSWENIFSIGSSENVSAVSTTDPVVVSGLDSGAGVAGGVVPGLVAAEPQQQKLMTTAMQTLPPCSSTPTFAPGSEVVLATVPSRSLSATLTATATLTLPLPTSTQKPSRSG
ncbi:hypothetical protein BH20ACI1_BH20ACI1_13140 [soil metagenome]